MIQHKILAVTLFSCSLLFANAAKPAETNTTVSAPATAKVAPIATEAAKPANTETKKSVTSQDIQVFTSDNSDGKITPTTIEKAFVKAGFYSAANNDMNFPYKRDFNKTDYAVYNLFATYKKEIVADLIKEYPSIGLFAPMSISIYTKKGTHTISVATLTTARIAHITGIPADHPALVKLDKAVKDVLKAAMPHGKFESLANKSIAPKGDLVTKYEFTVGKDEDIDTVKEDFEMAFEGELSPNGFSMPAFNELSDEIEDIGYDFYEVYSICKIPVIYTVSQKHPEAGGYAPCSLYVYKKEDENKVHIAYPSVYNWFSSMGIQDNASVEVLMDAQKKMEGILEKITKK